MTYPSERGRIIPPRLDDRTWQDLVDELRALIPVYAPPWTDHNPSDPGITIIEMFAMLVEGLIYRLNRVPDKHYIAFLNLLGITRNPPTPGADLSDIHIERRGDRCAGRHPGADRGNRSSNRPLFLKPTPTQRYYR